MLTPMDGLRWGFETYFMNLHLFILHISIFIDMQFYLNTFEPTFRGMVRDGKATQGFSPWA